MWTQAPQGREGYTAGWHFQNDGPGWVWDNLRKKPNLIRNPWVGHDGLPGWYRNPDGTKRMNWGHGIGNNYWDIMPFGGDDMYATAQYYASLLAMAEIEQAAADHPGWDLPGGALALDAAALRAHAAEVKLAANRKFWNSETGRFYGAIDVNGKGWEYGFTFLNLDAIWYGIASPEHARSIMDWLGGRRTVEGDTSTGEDIYHWRFGPRATTRRNLEWYGQGWTHPESIPWGGQVQDGGAVLGFAFYDYWARLKVLGPEDAWRRLTQTLEWERGTRQLSRNSASPRISRIGAGHDLTGHPPAPAAIRAGDGHSQCLVPRRAVGYQGLSGPDRGGGKGPAARPDPDRNTARVSHPEETGCLPVPALAG